MRVISILSVDDAVGEEGVVVSRSIQTERLYISPSLYNVYGGRSVFIGLERISVIQ